MLDLKNTELAVVGSDRHGEWYGPMYYGYTHEVSLDEAVVKFQTQYPQAIHIRVDIAFPDNRR